MRVLVRLRTSCRARDDHEATIRHAQCIIDLEPTDEAAVRIQMEAHLALGDRGAALRSYHRYAEVLERDLALEPGEAIGAIYRQLRANTPTARNCRARTWHRRRSAARGPRPRTGPAQPGMDRRAGGGPTSCCCPANRGSGSPALPWSWDGAFERGTWWLRLGHEAAGRLPWGPVIDLLRSDALRSPSTRWARSGGPGSLVSSPSSSRASAPAPSRGATWLSAIGYSMQ